MNVDMESDFKECARCAAKPGMPRLCDACLYNRELVGMLHSEIARLKGIQELVNFKLPLGIVVELQHVVEQYDKEHYFNVLTSLNRLEDLVRADLRILVNMPEVFQGE
jgi:hypothetical protein